MKKNFLAFAPYLIALGINFYILPLWANDTGSAMLFMLCVMPLIACVSGVIYGALNGFSLLLPLAAALLFLPTIFLYYNSSAGIYTMVYAAAALAGTAIGNAFHKKESGV